MILACFKSSLFSLELNKRAWASRPSRLRKAIESTMRRHLAILFGSLLVTIFLGCQQVQKPELKGEGPLAVVVPRGSTAPEYHAPIERWRTIHMEAVNQGDFTERECVLCHNPNTGCNQCHQYIGAKVISVPEAHLYWPEMKK